MSKKRGLQSKEVPQELTLFQKFNLLYGSFDHLIKWSPEERRLAWLAHRGKLLKEWMDDSDHFGWRPRGFWEFDFPGMLEKYATDPEWPGWVSEEDELRALQEIGQITLEELDKLENGELYEGQGRIVPGYKKPTS